MTMIRRTARLVAACVAIAMGQISLASAESLWICADRTETGVDQRKYAIIGNTLVDRSSEEFLATWNMPKDMVDRAGTYTILTNNEFALIAVMASASEKSLYSITLFINKKTKRFETLAYDIKLPDLSRPVRSEGTCSYIR